ncbi:MAG: hypothetical protein LUJ25_07145 [Firmicutes bacterium]|nr:hypothetical protein [Bacillota bacterium]
MAVGLAASLVAMSIGTTIQAVSSYNQAQAQAANYRSQAAAAEQQATIASANQRLAEEQASAERKQGYEEMQTKRLEAARIIGQQRAQMGGSGVAVDQGSFLDILADTASSGEISAINAYNQGIDRAYAQEIEAWNYENQAGAYRAQASSFRKAASNASSGAIWGALGTAATGIASIGTTWGMGTNWKY